MSDIFAISLVVLIVGIALWRLVRSFRKRDDDCGCGNCGCR